MTLSADALRAKAARCAARLLWELLGAAPPEQPVAAAVTGGAWAVRVEVGPDRQAAAGPPPGSATGPAAPAPVPVGAVADALRAALATAARPLKVGGLARAAGLDPPSSWCREVLRRLVAAGQVRHLPGHYYWPAERPLPPP